MSRKTLLLTLLFLLSISLPYLLAVRLAGPEAVFGGFLLNPQDGHSYLAKMYQGWRGEWRFTLPFTAEPGEGVFLFMFYIFLGHLARWTGLSLIVIYHLARLAGALALAAALLRFYRRCTAQNWAGWSLAASLFCLGMGWLLLPTGRIPTDFWVAETYPFLSAFANPHFPLSLALLVWLLTLPAGVSGQPDGRWSRPAIVQVFLAGLLLSLLSPFGLILALMVLGGLWFWEAVGRLRLAGLSGVWRGEASAPLRSLLLRIAVSFAGGAPFIVYYLWLTRTHPQLAVWNAQNLTLTPAAWDVALALSPALLLALPGVVWAWRSGALGTRLPTAGTPQARLLVVWAVIGLAFIYFPFSLQRRFMLGLFVPLVGLAAYGLHAIAAARPRLAGCLSALAFLLALPSTLLILLVGLFGAQSQNPQLYLTRSENEALQWIAANAPADALVLASAEIGLVIPGATGRRVIYGHPYETVSAVAEEAAVRQFYAGRNFDPGAFLAQRGVEFVFYGPREQLLGTLPPALPLEAAFTTSDVTVYRVVAR